MSEFTQNTITSKVRKYCNLLGLDLSESEINELESKNYISLEGRALSEVGSVFILVAALSSANSGTDRKNITFQDLAQEVTDSAYCAGILLCCWNSEPAGKCCLYLTLVASQLAVRIYYTS